MFKMTAGTMQRNNKFDMAKVVRRSVKNLRVKHGKKIKPVMVHKLWKDYIELSVTPMLLKYGKVQIDKNTSLEIVGTREIKLIRLKRNGELSSTTKENKLRAGISYEIVYTDTNYKRGVLVFTACEALKKAVSEHLKNNSTYYRIVA